MSSVSAQPAPSPEELLKLRASSSETYPRFDQAFSPERQELLRPILEATRFCGEMDMRIKQAFEKLEPEEKNNKVNKAVTLLGVECQKMGFLCGATEVAETLHVLVTDPAKAKAAKSVLLNHYITFLSFAPACLEEIKRAKLTLTEVKSSEAVEAQDAITKAEEVFQTTITTATKALTVLRDK